MWTTIKTGALKFHRSFHSSGVIWLARGQVVLGAVWAALTAVDLAPIIGDPKYVTAWLVFSGIITEYTRRSRTYQDEDGHLLPRRDDQTVNVTVNTAAPASPLGPSDGNTK
jgi:hypothetical protein